MIAGILLGPSLLGRVAPRTFHSLFPAEGLEALSVLSQIGLILFLFLVGMRVRPSDVWGLAGPAVLASSASMLVPFALGSLLAIPLHQSNPTSFPLPEFALFIGTAMSVTALPVLARILTELNLLRTRTAAIAISCAALDDVAAWCILALIMATSAVAWLPVVAGLCFTLHAWRSWCARCYTAIHRVSRQRWCYYLFPVGLQNRWGSTLYSARF